MRRLRRTPGRESPDLSEPEAVPSGRRRWRFAWFLLGALTLVGAAVGVAVATDDSLSKVPGTIRLATAARSFTLDDVRAGRPRVSLEAFRGRPVVLNFFASWCSPCVREMPALQATSERWKGRAQFVGVSFNDSRDSARGALDQAGVSYPAGFDPTSDVAYDYGIGGLPTTVFISADGTALERKDGEISELQLRKILDRIFGPGSPGA